MRRAEDSGPAEPGATSCARSGVLDVEAMRWGVATQRRLERWQAARPLIAEAVRAVLIVLLWRRPGRPFRRHLLGG